MPSHAQTMAASPEHVTSTMTHRPRALHPASTGNAHSPSRQSSAVVHGDPGPPSASVGPEELVVEQAQQLRASMVARTSRMAPR